jgi:hypothetical protein
MFFLTYIQGNLVNEWVKGVNAWLRTQVTTQGWATTDERLWNGVIGAFNRQYADVLEQEKAQAELGRGLRMQNGDLDGLITRFEQLVCHANYDINQPLVLRIFTDALPHAMYEYIFKNIQPRDYEGWREASIQQQKVFVHMKSRLEQFNPRKTRRWGAAIGRATTTTTMLIDGVDQTFQTFQIRTQWIYPREEHDWLKQKTTNQEETATNPKKERNEGRVRQQGKGKSLHVSIVANQVTLKEIVDSPRGKTLFIDRIKDLHAPDKRMRKRTGYMPLEALLMTAASLKDVLHNRRLKHGLKE